MYVKLSLKLYTKHKLERSYYILLADFSTLESWEERKQ